MYFFPFIESIFYLSLGIIVILIFLIVFHFKQRIESLEKKGFLFTEMYNNLVKELSIIKSVVYSPPVVQQKQNVVFSTEPQNSNVYKKIVVMEKLTEEEEDESEDDYDEEENEKTYDNMEVVEIESFSEFTTKEIEVNDLEVNESEEKFDIHVLKLEPEPEPEPENTFNNDLPNTNNNNSISYQKMNLQELKMMVISKGLSTNPSKMKRAELLKLLEEVI